MEIKYFGHASFYLKGKNATVITDPFDPQMVGLKFPKIEADIVTISHQHPDHNRADLVSGNPLVLNFPGEYEKKGVKITGFASFHDKKEGQERGKNTIFKVEIDGFSILHCGDLGHQIEDNLVEEIEKVDVLLIPIGGYYTIDENEAIDISRKIEPSVVIPMHYNHPKINPQIFANLSPLESFLKKIGANDVQPVKKLSLKKDDLLEEMKVVVLEIYNN